MTKHARTEVHGLCTIKSNLRLLLFISYFHCFIKLKLFIPQEKDYFDPRKYYTVYFFMRFFYAQILNSHEWPRQNFPLQYHYNIKQTGDENKEKYILGDHKLIQYWILRTNIIRIVWQTVRRITDEIFGVKGLLALLLTLWEELKFYE